MIKTLSMTVLALMVSASAFAGSTRLEASTSEHRKNAADVDAVERITSVTAVDAKIFSVSGGDPAMNGAYVNLAVWGSVETGWTVYELANVSNWKLLPSAKKGYAKLALVRDNIDAEGNIVKEKSIMYLNLTKAEQGIVEVEEVKTK